MANTYTQLHIQFVFAVKYRAAVIHRTWKDELEKYLTGAITNHGHKVLQLNCQPDHVHILVGYRVDQAISSFMNEIKKQSSAWINRKRLTGSQFRWQTGYAAFSYSKSHLPAVINYIKNQDQHHRKINFRDEYRSILIKNDVPYDDAYIFENLY